MKHLSLLFIVLQVIVACNQTNRVELPEYGDAVIPGEYTNQNGEIVSAETLKDKVIVTDFVFTHCPSICPPMAQQMMRVQEEFSGNEDLQLLSFSIDPVRDTVERLKWYTERIGVDDNMWSFVTAEQAVIDSTAKNLMVFQEADETAPGGFNHQSRFILIDKNGKARGYYNGVDEKDVDKLIEDLRILLK